MYSKISLWISLMCLGGCILAGCHQKGLSGTRAPKDGSTYCIVLESVQPSLQDSISRMLRAQGLPEKQCQVHTGSNSSLVSYWLIRHARSVTEGERGAWLARWRRHSLIAAAGPLTSIKAETIGVVEPILYVRLKDGAIVQASDEAWMEQRFGRIISRSSTAPVEYQIAAPLSVGMEIFGMAQELRQLRIVASVQVLQYAFHKDN